MKKLQELLDDEHEKSSYMLGSELWESQFDGFLNLMNMLWRVRNRRKYYMPSDSVPGQQLHSQSSPGDLAVVARQTI